MNETMWSVRYSVWGRTEDRATVRLWTRTWNSRVWHVVDSVLESLDD